MYNQPKCYLDAKISILNIFEHAKKNYWRYYNERTVSTIQIIID